MLGAKFSINKYSYFRPPRSTICLLPPPPRRFALVTGLVLRMEVHRIAPMYEIMLDQTLSDRLLYACNCSRVRLINRFTFFRLQVLWFEQQIEKKRLKRDFSSSFDAHPFDYPYYDANLLNQQLNLAGSHYRASSQPNVFPDPLFKEQWYLVSTRHLG